MNNQERLAAVEAELRSIHQAAGDAPLTDDQQTQWDALSDERSQLVAAIERDERRRTLARSLSDRPGYVESGDGTRGAPAFHAQRDPFALLEGRRADMGTGEYRKALVDANIRANEDRIEDGDNAAHFERLLKRHAKDTAWAVNLLARSRPEYESGWAKLMCGRAELLTSEERAALAVGTNTQGGYLVPTHLDPTLILTNSGSGNELRQISRVVTITGGANTWHGVTTAGVTASWDAELSEVSDDTPGVGTAGIPVNSAKSLVQASIEAFEDISGLTTDVLMLFADARDRLEGAAFATGSGSGQPKGIFTALDATTTVEIISTTAATIGEVDIHAVYRGVPRRWRGKSTWLMNPLYALAIKRLGTAVSSSFSGDLTAPVSDRILARPVVESDDAPTTQTTTVNDNEIVFGDFSNYVIVDKPGSTSVEFIPHLFNTANNLPDGRRGWYMHFRTGGDAANVLAFRLLQDKTSA